MIKVEITSATNFKSTTSSILASKSLKALHSTAVLSVKNVRILGSKHTEEVRKLLTDETKEYFEKLFGYKSPEYHLTKRFFCLGIDNDENELVGVICFDDHPNVPAVPPWDWSSYLANLYGIKYMIPYTTVWMYYALWDFRYSKLFAKPILQFLYEQYEYVEYVAMICPPGLSCPFIECFSTRILPLGFVNPRAIQTLYEIKRTNFVCQYTIRRAVEEDNDDLVDIMPKIIEETYGEYYMSEMLSLEDTGRQIIVAEYKGCAVGVLCLNENVNYDLLNQEFHLIPFNGFKKPHENDEFFLQKSDDRDSGPTFDEQEKDLEMMSAGPAQSVSAQSLLEEEDSGCHDYDDDFSLVSLNSSLIFNMRLDDKDKEDMDYISNASSDESMKSADSKFSTLVLSEDVGYKNHLNRSWESTLSDRRASKKVPEEMPIFYGEPNAFAMEIGGVLSDHECCMFQLFQAAFQCFPDRDYIVCSFPTTTCLCTVKKHFGRVTPRKSSLFPHELYVLHKSIVLGMPNVRCGCSRDKPKVKKLLKTLDKASAIEESFNKAVDVMASDTKAYVFLCENKIVGCATVGEESDHEYLELHYAVESYVSTKFSRFGTYGYIEHFVVSPIFQSQMSFFLRKLHTLSDFYILFYRLNLHNNVSFKQKSIVNAMGYMLPVQENKRTKYDDDVMQEYSFPDAVTQKHQPFALFLSTSALTAIPRVEVTHKIVVIGASATALSFLKSLIFGQVRKCLVVFTNVTLITLHSVYQKRVTKLQEMAFMHDDLCSFCPLDSMYQTFLKSYVNTVNGLMSSINRKKKMIYLNDRTGIPYDYLFLMCGQQFQTPPVPEAEKKEFPSNVFIVNTVNDASRAFNMLKTFVITSNEDPQIVVYGHYLEAFCCLSALIEFGLSPKSLIYIDPPPEKSNEDSHVHLTDFFNNKDIELTVFQEIIKKGITIYADYKIVDWRYDRKTGQITNAKFESHSKIVMIELTAMFMYYSKSVSRKTFQAIHNSGLVINGNLVIDKKCRTNDPFIYAAGPLTMYSTKLHAGHLMHQYFNGHETGYDLGMQIRKLLIPKQFQDNPVQKRLRNQPKLEHGVFPGRLYYVKIFKPGKPIPLDIAIANTTYGRVITTGSLKDLDKQMYFRLHLNQYDTIETITCLSKQELNLSNLVSLYGRHESIFNNLILRYYLKMIPDLYLYFNQPWLSAAFHPKFDNLLENFEQMWASLQTSDKIPLIDAIKDKLAKNNWNRVSPDLEDEIVEICKETNYFKIIENKLLMFLEDNSMYLPMYAHQMLIRWIQHKIEASPFFVQNTSLSYDVRSHVNKLYS